MVLNNNQLNNVNNIVSNINKITGNNKIAGGTVVSFLYLNYHHDPYPVIIISGVSSKRIFGINLHYLPFNIFRTLLRKWGDNPVFNYENVVKNHNFLKKAFRSYNYEFIRNAKKVNWKTIIQAMTVLRKYPQNEIVKLQKMVDKQILTQNPQLINEIYNRIMKEQKDVFERLMAHKQKREEGKI